MKISIVDDHLVVAQSLAISLDRHYGGENVAEDLLKLNFVEISKKDILLLDFDLGDWGDAYAVLNELDKIQGATVKVLIFSSYTTTRVLMTCYHPLVKGFIHKSQDFSQFVFAIDSIMNGHTWYQKEVENRVKQVLELPKSAILSDREIELARLHSQGYSREEIAEKLSLSRHTVNNHFTKMFQKLEIDSAREL